MKEYKIYIPLKLNNGMVIDNSHFKKLESDFIKKCSGVTRAGKVNGQWMEQGKIYRDTSIQYFVSGKLSTIKSILKKHNKSFKQIVFYIAVNSSSVTFFNPNMTGKK